MPKGYAICKTVGSQCNTRCKTWKCGQMMTKGQPCGTSQRAGCSVSKSGGKPHGITVNEGYNVGGQARPDSMKSELARFSNQDSSFNGSGDSFNDINLSEEMLVWCTQLVVHQCNFDNKPLASAQCWQRAKVLWSHVDSVNIFLVDLPPGMCEEDAPAR